MDELLAQRLFTRRTWRVNWREAALFVFVGVTWLLGMAGLWAVASA